VATLIGTNLSVHAATSMVTMMLIGSAKTAHAAEWVATLITTPILFVFSELIPKNLFLYRADALMPVVSPVLYGSYKILRWSGAIRLMQSVSALFAKLTHTPKPSKVAVESQQRHEIAAILRDTQDEGFLTGVQVGIMNRLVIASATPVKEVVTNISKVEKVGIDCDRDTLLGMLKGHAFTRMLVYEGSAQNIIGFVNVYQALGSDKPFESLHEFVKPIPRLQADTPVTDAIDLMQRDKLRIMLVNRPSRSGRSKPVGIVTMKDLAEELLGALAAW
jgi:CBS domain containing-hemolysin-like protein